MKQDESTRAVLVTGTSTGIGRHTALRLDQLGYQVFATVRKERDADSISSQSSDRLIPLILDVTDPSSLDRAVEIVTQEVSERGLWGLVNNAAIAFVSPLEFAPLAEFRDLYEVNVFGLLDITQKFLPLIRLARGRIINISSTASNAVAPFHGPYSSSKLALNGLTDSLRLELKPLGVKVSLVIFGSVQTPIWSSGGEKSTQVAQGFPPEALALYGENLRGLRDYFNRIGKNGITTEQSFKPILHALTAERPKTRYLVGWDARYHYLLRILFYGRLGDSIMIRTIGLKEKYETPEIAKTTKNEDE
jgi:NAD(P)-dependent dehydrogenase (short-subunit alcohol dehydrogenase family)